jgi:hypothetical protein
MRNLRHAVIDSSFIKIIKDPLYLVGKTKIIDLFKDFLKGLNVTFKDNQTGEENVGFTPTSYRAYVARFDNGIFTVLQNTIGTITWTEVEEHWWRGTLPELVPYGKVACFATVDTYGGAYKLDFGTPTDNDISYADLITYNPSATTWVPGDGLGRGFLEIRIYS